MQFDDFHTYRPYGSARELFNDKTQEICLSGPAGTGKSMACLQKMFVLAMVNPRMRGLIVRKTQTSLTSTGLVTWREHVITEAQKRGLVRFYGGSPVEPPQYQFHNGSVVSLTGMDKSEKVMSSEFDIIFVQEAIELTLEDWEKLTSRLRNGRLSFHQIMADTNPDASTHWLRQRSIDGPLKMIPCVHEDNPTLYDHEKKDWTERGRLYLATLDNLTGTRFERLRHGKWVSAEGAIFPDFDYATHVVDSFEVPKSWTRYVSIDFGYTNPTVIQWWAVDEDGRLYMYREIYMTRTIIEDHVKRIKELTLDLNGAWKEPKPSKWLTDHDAEDRATMEKHLGIRTTGANKRVKVGIQALSERLRVQPDGKPRIFWMRNALVRTDPRLQAAHKPTQTYDEISSYVWDQNKTDKGEDQPKKSDDHGIDATRYIVMHLDYEPEKPTVSFLDL